MRARAEFGEKAHAATISRAAAYLMVRILHAFHSQRVKFVQMAD